MVWQLLYIRSHHKSGASAAADMPPRRCTPQGAAVRPMHQLWQRQSRPCLRDPVEGQAQQWEARLAALPEAPRPCWPAGAGVQRQAVHGRPLDPYEAAAVGHGAEDGAWRCRRLPRSLGLARLPLRAAGGCDVGHLGKPCSCMEHVTCCCAQYQLNG